MFAESYLRRQYDEGFQKGLQDVEAARVKGEASQQSQGWNRGGICDPIELGRAVGRAEERKRWLEWYNRNLRAAAAGDGFDEPFPDAI
jgi:hypothetical protein